MDSNLFITIFNLTCLFIIVSGMFTGFVRGSKKSLFFLIFFLGFLIVGYLTMPIVSNKMLTLDISGYNLEALIHEQIVKNVPKLAPLMNDNTLFMSFVDALTQMIFRIAWIILIIILASTIWPIITWIFWMIFAKKKKKSFSNRLTGLFIGLLNSFIILLFIAIPLSGFSSMAKSLENVKFEDKETNPEIIQLSNTEVDAMTPEDAIALLTSYSSTYIGQFFQKTKITENSIDETLFDEVFQLKFNNNKIKLRKEINIVGNVVSELSNEVDLKNPKVLNEILNLDEENLKSYINQISELKLINVIVPLGIEFIYLTEDEKLQGIDLTEEDFNNLLKINYTNEFKNLSTAVIEGYEMLGSDFKNVNYLNLDEEKTITILDKLTELALLDTLGPIGLKMLLNKEQVASIIDEQTLDVKIINYQEELKNIGKLYQAILVLDLSTSKFKEIDYANINDDDLINIANRLYELQIIQSSTPSVINYLVNNSMPKELSDYILKETIYEVNWNAREIASILLLSKLLMANNVLDSDFNFENLLTEITSRPLAKLMIDSELVSNSLTPLVKGLISKQDNDIFKEVVISDDFTWTEEELYSIFQVVRLSKDLISDEQIDFSTISNEYIDEITTAMSNSEIIMGNMTSILTSLTQKEEVNINLTIEENYNWTYSEINSIFKSVKIIHSRGGEITNIFGLEDEELNVLLNSKIISKTMIEYLYEYTASGKELESILIINLEKDDAEWYDRTDNPGELRKLFKSLGLLLGKEYNLGDEFDINRITSLSDDEITTLLASIVVSDSLIKKIIDLSNNELAELLIVRLNDTDPSWKDSQSNGELRNFLKSFKLLFGNDVNINEPNLDINMIIKLSDEELNQLIASQIISDSAINAIYKLANNELINVLYIPSNYPKYSNNWYGSNGELLAFIKGVKVIKPADGDIAEISLNIKDFYDDEKTSILLKSDVFRESIICNIENSEGANVSLIVDDLRSPNELEKFIKGIKIILPDGNLDNITYDLVAFYDDENLDILLDSKVIEKSIINHIKTSKASEDNVLIVTNLEVEGELRRFFKSVQIILPNGDISEINLNVDSIYHKTDEELNTLFSSKVILDSIYHNIETSEVAINGSLVTTNLRQPGEMKNLIRALEIIIPNPTNGIDDIDFETNNFFKEDHELDIILTSQVVSDSIINRIVTSQANNVLDTTYINEEGELKRLIKALQVVLNNQAIDELAIDIDQIVYFDLDILLDSRVMEKTIINHIEPLFAFGGSLYEYMNLPDDISWERDYSTTPPTEGDLKPFLEALQMMDKAGVNYQNINIEAIAESDSDELATALLHSRIISKSISKMLKKVISDAGIFYPIDDKEYTHLELVTHLDGIKAAWLIFG